MATQYHKLAALFRAYGYHIFSVAGAAGIFFIVVYIRSWPHLRYQWYKDEVRSAPTSFFTLPAQPQTAHSFFSQTPTSKELDDNPQTYSHAHILYVNGHTVHPHPDISRIDTFIFTEPFFMPRFINYAFWSHPCEAHIVSSVSKSADWLSVDRFRRWHDLIASLTSSGPVVALDIGAQQGDTAVQIAPFASLTIALEVHPQTFVALQTNADVNPHLNIHPYNVAASTEERDSTETWCYSCNGGAGDRSGNECFNASLVHVPSFLRQRYDKALLQHLAFIKIDTEGFDLPILLTLQPLLQEAHIKPWIYLEWYIDHVSHADRHQYHEAAAKLGYAIFTPDGSNRIDVLTHDKLPDLLLRPL